MPSIGAQHKPSAMYSKRKATNYFSCPHLFVKFLVELCSLHTSAKACVRGALRKTVQEPNVVMQNKLAIFPVDLKIFYLQVLFSMLYFKS